MAESEGLTPNEAAVAARIPLKQVHRIIDSGLLNGAVRIRDGARVISASGLVGLKLAHLTADILSPAARRRVIGAVLRNPDVETVKEQAVSVETGPVASELREGLDALHEVRRMVVSDARVLGGVPCFRETRIPVHDIADMLANGDDREAILRAYPRLTGRQVEMAGLYAAAYPRRGRPRRVPAWRTGAPKSSRVLQPDGRRPAS